MRPISLAIPLFLSLSLSACSVMPEWLGNAEEPALEGKRIAILKTESTLRTDAKLENTSVHVPTTQSNQRWYKTQGVSSLTPENLTLDDNIKIIQRRSIGKGGTDINPLKHNPIIAQDKLYTLDGKGNITAFDALNIKKVLWRYQHKTQNGHALNGGMSYHENTLYVTTGTNRIIALNAENGNKIWQRDLNGITRSAPEVRNQTLFVNTAQNHLYALNAKTGMILWSHSGIEESLSTFGSASPTAANDLVLAPYSSGNLFALRQDNGKEIWSEYFGKPHNNNHFLTDIDASPLVKRGMAFILSNDGLLAATDVFSGLRIWEQEIGGNNTPWLAGEYLYLLSDKQQLIAVHALSGGIKWISQLPDFKKGDKQSPILWNGPIMANGQLYVVNNRGKMRSISVQDGTTTKQYKLPGTFYTSPVIAHNRIYLINNDGTLIVFANKS